MTRKGNCAQCGAPLLVDLAIAVCPACELRGALDPFAEPPSPGFAGTPLPTPAEVCEPPVPAAVFGDYELIEEIARGGMGVVYRARQVSLGRIVALKMLLAGPLAGRDFIQRFRTEAAAAASLQHPNIVAIHEVGFAEGQHFFAMDFVAGPTLSQLVAQGPVAARQAASHLKIIAEAIHFAHERKVLHRDLKPSNILIDSTTGLPRITDFGLAKRLETDTELTLSGQVLGSPNFMSPEQASARRGAVGKWSDVYSLGAILYYLVTGRPPFNGETLADVLQQVANSEPLAPRLLAPRVPRDLETICLKCLEKEASGRYQTAAELAAELERFLQDEPILARPVSSLEHAWRWCRRKPATASLGAATLLLFLGISIGSPVAIIHITRARNTAQEERERADQHLYDSDLNVVQHAWDEGDFGVAHELLAAHLPRPGQTDRRGFEWFYFWNLSRGDQRMSFTNHSQPVNCVALSPDGKMLATGSVGSPVQIWDCLSGKPVKSFREDEVVSLAFSSTGGLLAVGGRDQVVVWNLETGRPLFKHQEPFARFHAALPSLPNTLVLGAHAGLFGADGGSVEIWDYVSHEKKLVLPESGGNITLALHADLLASGNWHGATRIWNLVTGHLLKTLDTAGSLARALSIDGRTLATAQWNGRVELWDVESGRSLGALSTPPRISWCLAFSPDGKSLATAGADQIVHLCDLGTRQPTAALRGHGSEIISLDFSSDGQTLASGGKDRSAMLWSAPFTAASPTLPRPHLTSPPVFSPDSQLIAGGFDTNSVAAWDPGTLQVKAVLPDAHDVLAFSPNGNALIVRGTNYFLRTFDLAARTIGATVFRGPFASDRDYAVLSPDRQIIANGSVAGALTFSRARTGEVIADYPHAYAGAIFPFTFSPDGRFVATCGMDPESDLGGPVKIWNALTGELIPAAAARNTGGVLSCAFSPDSRILATGSIDTSIHFWETSAWNEIARSCRHKEFVRALAFSPDGKTLASASNDGTLKFWNAHTHRALASLVLPDGDVPIYLAFSPDSQFLAAWGNDRALRVWRAPVLDKK